MKASLGTMCVALRLPQLSPAGAEENGGGACDVAEAKALLNSDQQFKTLDEQGKKVETFGPNKVNLIVSTNICAIYPAIAVSGELESAGRRTRARNEVGRGKTGQDSTKPQSSLYQGAIEGEDCQTNAVSTCILSRLVYRMTGHIPLPASTYKRGLRIRSKNKSSLSSACRFASSYLIRWKIKSERAASRLRASRSPCGTREPKTEHTLPESLTRVHSYSEARRANGALRTDRLDDRLAEVYKPDGTQSRSYPGNLRSLMAYSGQYHRNVPVH